MRSVAGVAYNVVCISATDGAMGEQIGALVAQGLGFRLVNEQIVATAAEQAGIDARVMADVEQRRPVVARVIAQLPRARGPDLLHALVRPSAAPPASGVEGLRAIIRDVIEDVAISRNAVIVLHGASHALADREDTLRVLITAGVHTRRSRIQAARDLSEGEAAKRVARGDANRADYIKRFYGVGRELPTHYDIVLNSDRLSVRQAVEIVVGAASAPG